MSETVIAIATAPAVSTAVPPAVAGNAAAATETTDTPAKGRFQSALLQQLLGQLAPGGDPAAATPEAASDVLQATAGDAQPTTGQVETGGTDLPLPGQFLPLDPSLLLATPVQKTLPAGNELTAALLVAANVLNGKGPAATPRLNLTPVANAVAQATAAPTATAQALPEVFAVQPGPATQQAVVTATQAAALAAESSGQTTALPVTAVSSTVPLTNPLAAPAAVPNVAVPPGALPVITIPVAQPGWDQALGQRVQWLVGQQLQGAELRITPPNMGPIEVRISIGHDQQTVVNFASPHAAVRDAIEAAVPRLRDMLGNNGQDLVNVNVSQHSFAEQRRQAAQSGGGRESSYLGDLPADVADGASSMSASIRTGAGLVDYFA